MPRLPVPFPPLPRALLHDAWWLDPAAQILPLPRVAPAALPLPPAPAAALS